MIHGNKIVIASKRNSSNKRVFIPEKIVAGGNVYVQPYTFSSVSLSAQSLILSQRASVVFSVTISGNTVIMLSPFTAELLRSYINRVNKMLPDTTSKRFTVLREPGRKDSSWDKNFFDGNAKITT